MTPATAVTGEDRTLRLGKFWPRDVVVVLLLPLIGIQMLLALIYVPQALRGLDDFRQLYVGGYMVRTGHAIELYNYEAQGRFEDSLVPVGGHFQLLINHPAFEELLFVPLSLLTYKTAYWLFMVFNGALLLLCLGLLKHRLKVLSDRWKWFPILLIPAFFPVARGLQKGQDSIIMLTLLAAALWALDREKQFLAGFLIGIGIFKFQVAIPIALLFLFWRRWRFSIGFAVSSVAATLVSLWMVGLGGARDYVHMLLAMSLRLTSEAGMRLYSTDPREMINLRGLFSAIFFNGNLAHGYVQLLVAVCSVAVLLAAARQLPSLPLAIAAASLVSYHLIAHDASIFIIVICTALCSGSVWDGAVAMLLLIAPLCATIPAYGCLAAIPLLVLFLLMLGKNSDCTEFTAGSRQNAIAEGSPCR